MALSSEDDFVILICTNPDPIETETVRKEILISTTDILSWDLRTIRRCQTVKIRAGRNRLVAYHPILCVLFLFSVLGKERKTERKLFKQIILSSFLKHVVIMLFQRLSLLISVFRNRLIEQSSYFQGLLCGNFR